MNRKSKNLIQKSLATVALATAVAAPAFAWKPSTHIYAANQAISSVLAGQNVVNIDGNNYPVDPRVAQAIRNFPDYYRAGVIGPDAYPDIYVGQSCIHPDTRSNNGKTTPDMGNGKSYSYEWLRHVYESGWSTYNSKNGNADGQKVLAFAYGFLTHAAGDLFAHTFVNDFAKGTFPSVSEVQDLPIAARHIVVEGYVGKYTPPTNMTMPNGSDVLADFIWKTFMAHESVGGFVDSAGFDAKELGRGEMFDFFFDLRSQVIQAQEDIEWYGFLDPVGYLTMYAFLVAWEWDLDDGLADWPHMSQQLAQDIFVNSSYSDATSTAKYFVLWHVLDMLGVPEPVQHLLFLIDGIMQFIGLLHEPLKQGALLFADFMIEKHTGLTLDEIIEYITSPENQIDNPALGLSPTTSQTLDMMMGRPTGTNQPLNPNTFAPMANTITMSKLVLLGPDAMNQMLYNYRVGEYYVPAGSTTDNENAMLGYIRTLDGHQQWRKTTTVNMQNSNAGAQMSEGMPLWRDMVARDRVFRQIFQDWQNGTAQFPALGELPELLMNTPAPASTLTIQGSNVVVNGKHFVGGATTFKIDGVPSYYWNLNEIGAKGQILPGGASSEATGSNVIGPISGPDGDYTLKYQTRGVTIDGPGLLDTEKNKSLTLDATPPTITVPTPNEGQSFDVIQNFNLNFDIVDAGSGVQTFTSTFDGQPISDGAFIDAFMLDAGEHTFALTATDKIGNQSAYTRKFLVQATIPGLLGAIQRGQNEGLYNKNINPFIAILDGAQAAFLKGDLATAANKVEAARNHMSTQIGKDAQTEFANRFIGWCNELMGRLRA